MEVIGIEAQEKKSMFCDRAMNQLMLHESKSQKDNLCITKIVVSLMNVLAHSRFQWEMIDFEGCLTQAQKYLESLQISEDGVHYEFVFVECHFG